MFRPFFSFFIIFFYLTNSILKNHKTVSQKITKADYHFHWSYGVFWGARFEQCSICTAHLLHIFLFLGHNPIEASVIQISWYGPLLHLYSVFRYWTLKANIVLYVVSCCSCKEFRRATFSRQCLGGL